MKAGLVRIFTPVPLKCGKRLEQALVGRDGNAAVGDHLCCLFAPQHRTGVDVRDVLLCEILAKPLGVLFSLK